MYTINGKEYTEFDINKWCAELSGLFITPFQVSGARVQVDSYIDGELQGVDAYNPCYEPQDTWPIIEKCWDVLMLTHVDEGDYAPKWQMLMEQHNCSKLVAACICFIELKEGE